MNYFELYPGDYLRDTGELSLAQHGAYLLLMASYYSTEDGLPADKMSLFRITRAMTKDEQAATLAVANRFFTIGDDGRLHSDRIDSDIAKAKVRIDAARMNGSKGGRPRKGNQNPAANQNGTEEKPTGFLLGSNPDNPDETEPLTGSKAHQTPYTNNSVGNSPESLGTSIASGASALSLVKRLRADAGMLDANPSRPELIALLASGHPEQLVVDTAVELRQAQAKPPSVKYLVATVQGRAQDAMRQRGPAGARAAGRPSVTETLMPGGYVGTPDHELPKDMRDAIAR